MIEKQSFVDDKKVIARNMKSGNKIPAPVIL